MPAERIPVCLVLGTGRCGSTALSGVLNGHPDVLSVSEFFAGLRGRDLSERAMDGVEFWKLVSTPHRADTLLLRHRITPEVLYPIHAPRPGAERFAWPAELPPPAGVAVPHLTERPDDLYAALEEAAPGRPRQPLSEHLRWLFGMLAGDRRPAVVVERSGGSLGQAGTLLRLFPEARVVHMYRDGRECAVSMSRHPRFKFAALQAALAAELGHDPYAETGPDGARPASSGREPSGPLAELTPDRFTPAAFDAYEVPLSRYGAMWSAGVAAGMPDLPGRDRRLDLDYRDLVERPAEKIAELFDFLGVARDPDREARHAAGIAARRDAREELGERQWTELTRACRMGMNRVYGTGRWT